ncbi:reverse transcriptase [Gossypium australe]|uniref:Reverse transcriptase n=1 Tax=Gossypium australe TaxID=47621 RepID=A0A5B6V5L8_9ROSI|nr:reverse transcriptase [Gossypium australe]
MEDGLPKISWQNKLVRNVKDRGLRDEVVVESKLEIGEDDYTISTKGDCSAKTIVVRLFEEKNWLQSCGKSSTGLTGRFQVVDLDNKFFLVKLSNQKDYDNALMRGSWIIYGHYLVTRDFTRSESYPSKMVVCLRIISQVVGKIIKVYYNTIEAKRGACLSSVTSVATIGTLRRVV